MKEQKYQCIDFAGGGGVGELSSNEGVMVVVSYRGKGIVFVVIMMMMMPVLGVMVAAGAVLVMLVNE